MAELTAVQGNAIQWTLTVAGAPDLSGGTYAAQIKPDYQKYSVTAVDTGTKTFTVSGRCDSSTSLNHTGLIRVDGSTGNDGQYTVVSSTYDSSADTTAIVVSETVSSSTADGDVTGFIADLTIDDTNANTGVFVLSATDATTAAFRPSTDVARLQLVDRNFGVYEFDVTLSGSTVSYGFGRVYLQREVHIA